MTRTKTQKALIALSLAALTLTTGACNTVKGLGKDIQSVGEAGDELI